VTGDFTCSGHSQQAILGVDRKRPVVVVAVFVNGINNRPIVLEFSHRPKSATLAAEALDYEVDYEWPGFERSTICKGLVVSDDETDPAHLYWNNSAHEFGRWAN
jgi:hypothetical protein